MITIRPAEPKDAQALRDVNDKIFINNPKYYDDVMTHYSETDDAKKVFQELAEQKQGYCFVAEENEQLVGYTNGDKKIIPYCKSTYFEIDNLGVIPEKKGKGVGKQLLTAITNWAKQKGYQKISLSCFCKNQEALDFYHNNGFSEISVDLYKTL